MKRRDLFAPLGAALLTGFLPIPASAQNQRNAKGYIRTNWSKDPYSYGSYSYVARNAKQRDRRTLEAPIDERIFFAGEAVHPDYNSTVHAAYESGVRTAEFVSDGSAQKIAIIGAGMSGMAAAKALSNEGREVVVFEARNRIGGRMWTDKRLGAPLDLGASWIHGTIDNPLTDLADSLSLKRVETDDSTIVRIKGGREIPEDEGPAWLDEVTTVQHEAGASSDQINSWAYLGQSDYDGDEVILPSGYAPILDGVAGDYKVNLGSVIAQVSLLSDGVSLTTKENQIHQFDAVIVTVSLGVLKSGDLRFSPPLPDDKLMAISKLGMGTLDKFYLKFDQVFWDKDFTWISTPDNDLPQGQFNQWFNLAKFVDAPILMAFNGAAPALELSELSDDGMLRRALSTLNSAYPI